MIKINWTLLATDVCVMLFSLLISWNPNRVRNPIADNPSLFIATIMAAFWVIDWAARCGERHLEIMELQEIVDMIEESEECLQ
jgi:hypothetical protein